MACHTPCHAKCSQAKDAEQALISLKKTSKQSQTNKMSVLNKIPRQSIACLYLHIKRAFNHLSYISDMTKHFISLTRTLKKRNTHIYRTYTKILCHTSFQKHIPYNTPRLLCHPDPAVSRNDASGAKAQIGWLGGSWTLTALVTRSMQQLKS